VITEAALSRGFCAHALGDTFILGLLPGFGKRCNDISGLEVERVALGGDPLEGPP
jgi:hypothetical protein